MNAILRYVCNDTCNATQSQSERDSRVRTVINLLRTHPALASHHHVSTSHQSQTGTRSKQATSKPPSLANMTSLRSTVVPPPSVTVYSEVTPMHRHHNRYHHHDVLLFNVSDRDINTTVNEMRDVNILHLMKIAHILHCIGISILGVLLLEVSKAVIVSNTTLNCSLV